MCINSVAMSVLSSVQFNLIFSYAIATSRHFDFHCVKIAHIRSFSSSYFPTFGLNMERYYVSFSPYSVRMRENADQKNSECKHFSRSAVFILSSNWIKCKYRNNSRLKSKWSFLRNNVPLSRIMFMRPLMVFKGTGFLCL